MLQIIRKFSISWVAKGLLILLIGSFGIWGITDFLGPKFRSDAVATVGKETISRTLFYQTFRSEMGRLRGKIGEDIDRNPDMMSALASQVLWNLIQESLLRQELNNINIVISDVSLKKIIQSEEMFFGDDGRFSKEKFDMMLVNQRMSEAYYINMLKQNLRKKLLIQAVANGLKIPETIAYPLLAQLKETRSIVVVNVLSNVFPVTKEPTSSELLDFYAANEQLFVVPESRDLSMVILDPKTYEKQIKNKGGSGIGEEEIHTQAIGLVYEKSKEIQDSLASGMTLPEIAKTMNLPFTTLQGVLLSGQNVDGKLIVGGKSVFTLDMVKRAYELGEGNESDLVELGDGRFYILLVDKTDPQRSPSFEEVEDKVLAAYKDTVRHKLALQKAKELVKDVRGGKSLETVARENNLSVQKLKNVSLSSPPKDLSSVLLVEIFSLSLKGVAMFPTKEGAQIGQVQKIVEGSPNKTDKKFLKNKEALNQEFVEDLLSQFMRSLELDFPVSINTKSFQEMLQAT